MVTSLAGQGDGAGRRGGPILVAEDDRNIASLVETYLRNAGFATVTASDGRQALNQLRSARPILVVLDLMLPRVDGWDVCREVRRVSDVPILILSARDEEMDRVLGFSLGADDYVVKPFSPRELVERVKAILRRAGRAPARLGGTLTAGPLTLDPQKHKVRLAGRPVPLTPLEFKLLQTLMSAPGRAFSREELLDRLYDGGESVITRVVDVHVGKLRQKIQDDPGRPRYIETVHGVGYRFSEDEGGAPGGGRGREP